MSLEKRDNILPIGLISKNWIGKCKTFINKHLCNTTAASNSPNFGNTLHSA